MIILSDQEKEYIDFESTIEKFGPIISTKSKIIIRCACGKFPKTSLGVFRRKLKRNHIYKCQNCYLIDPNFINKVRLLSKEAWKDPEKRKKASLKTKEQWKNEEYAQSVRNRSIEAWKDDNYRNKQKLTRGSSEWKSHHSKLSKRNWKSILYRNLVSNKIKKTCNSLEYREKRALIASNFLLSGKRSSIEIITTNILTSKSIGFKEQVAIGPYVFDFFLEDHNILIECQGEYWHSINKTKVKDFQKFEYIDKYFPKYRVLYLYERDFLNPMIIENRIQAFINNEKNEIKEFDFKKVEIRVINNKVKITRFSESELFLQSFHYAGFGRSAKVIYGAYLGDQLIAICKFSPPVRKEVATSLNFKIDEVLELDRFCIHPNYQKKNFASWFISRCINLVKSNLSIKCLVSFADTTYGHSGIIYKAAGWQEVGKVKSDYHYISSDGWVIHKKTLYNHAMKMSKKEAVYAKEFNYIKVFGKEKIKFIYCLV